MKRIRIPAVRCLVLHIAWLCINITHSDAALFLDIGNCSFTFSEDALLSFRKCMCSGTTKTYQVPISYINWRLKNQAQKSQAVYIKTQNNLSVSTHFVCTSTCRRVLFSTVQCNREQSVSSDSKCKDRNKCTFEKGQCPKTCLNVMWVNKDKIQITVKNRQLIQECLCTNERATTAASTTFVAITPLDITGSFSGTYVSHTTITIIAVILAVAIATIALISGIVMCRRRSRRMTTQLHGSQLYISPVDVVYHGPWFTDHLQNSTVDNDNFQGEFQHLSIDQRPSNICFNSPSEYSEIENNTSIYCNSVLNSSGYVDVTDVTYTRVTDQMYLTPTEQSYSIINYDIYSTISEQIYSTITEQIYSTITD